jgi:hypothetical protein
MISLLPDYLVFAAAWPDGTAFFVYGFEVDM